MKAIDDLLLTIPRSEQVLVNRLREIVKECLPKASENAYYDMGVPFYRHHRLICYIWPSSATWGKSEKKESKFKGVTLGFCQGNLMSNEDGALLAEGRKQVYVLYINSLKELDESQVRALLFEAGMIDDDFGAKKKKRSTKVSKQKRKR